MTNQLREITAKRKETANRRERERDEGRRKEGVGSLLATNIACPRRTDLLARSRRQWHDRCDIWNTRRSGHAGRGHGPRNLPAHIHVRRVA